MAQRFTIPVWNAVFYLLLGDMFVDEREIAKMPIKLFERFMYFIEMRFDIL